MENKQENNSGVTFTVTGQTRLVLTGATAVEGVTDGAVVASLPKGKFTARGEGLRVVSFSEERGELSVTGTFRDFSFTAGKTPFVKKLFK